MRNDFDKLKHWKNLLRSGEAMMGEVSRRMAGVTLALVERGFEKEKDPYEKNWARKKRPDGRMILRGKTGRLMSGWFARYVDKRRYEVLPSVMYAAAHQASKDPRRPSRKMVPSRPELPRGWAVALSRAAIAAMKKHYER